MRICLQNNILSRNQDISTGLSYKRYLMNFFRQALQLVGTPIRLELKSGENPDAGRRNKLAPRQQRKKRRLMKHTKRRD